jgi:TIR domain/WD domain, G-beta repeat
MSIFISYRREPSKAFADALQTELRRELRRLQMPSSADVFRDEVSIEPGSDFVSTLVTTIPTCDLFLAIVDGAYLADRFDDETDFVRRELLLALANRRTIVPIVMDHVQWPPQRALPEQAAHLGQLQAILHVTQAQPVARRIAELYRSHRLLDTPSLHEGEVQALAIAETATEAVIVSADDHGMVRFTALSTGTDYRPPLNVNDRDPADWNRRTATALAVEGRGKDVRVVLGLSDSSIALYDLESARVLGRPRQEVTWKFDPNRGPLAENGAYITAAVFVRRGSERRLVYANTAGQINLFPMETEGLPIYALGQVHCHGRDGLLVGGRQYLPRTGIGEFIRIQDMETGAIVAHVLEADSGLIRALLGSDTMGETRIISADEEGHLRMWDCNLHPLAPTGRHTGGVSALIEFNGTLISGGTEGSVQAWRLQDLNPLGVPRKEHTKAVSAIACATVRNRHVVVSGSKDGSVRSYLLEGLLQVPPSE